MNRAIRGATLGAVGVVLVVLAGCENNEANVKGTGVTPPGAAATSEEGTKVQTPPITKKAPEGYGAKGYPGQAKVKR